MEAIHEFEVEDMPVTVAVDAGGTSIHTTGPANGAARRSASAGCPLPADPPVPVHAMAIAALAEVAITSRGLGSGRLPHE